MTRKFTCTRLLSSLIARKEQRSIATKQRGMAAVEFALIIPLFVVLFFGLLDVSQRIEVADEIELYSFQVADYVGRIEGVSSSEIESFHTYASALMPEVYKSSSGISVTVSSIGMTPSNTLETLWTYQFGPNPPTLDPNSFSTAIDTPLFSIVAVSASADISLLFDYFNIGTTTITKVNAVMPRVVRAVALDGQLSNPTVTGFE